jgi:hypothetical protein
MAINEINTFDSNPQVAWGLDALSRLSGFQGNPSPVDLGNAATGLGKEFMGSWMAQQEALKQQEAQRRLQLYLQQMKNDLGYAGLQSQADTAAAQRQMELQKLTQSQGFERSMLPERMRLEMEKQRLANQGPLEVAKQQGASAMERLPLEIQKALAPQQMHNQGLAEVQRMRSEAEMKLQPLKNKGMIEAYRAAHGSAKPDVTTLMYLERKAKDQKIPEAQRDAWINERYKLLSTTPQGAMSLAPNVNAPVAPGMPMQGGGYRPTAAGMPPGVMTQPIQSWLSNIMDYMGMQRGYAPNDYEQMSIPGTPQTADLFRRNR